MTQKLRGLIFWLMVFLFLLSVPMALLYALDYSYNWQDKKLVQNGAFYFKSFPRATSIFINGKYKKTTPRLIKKMPPRSYIVEIKKDGFRSWKKELTIEPGLVTESKDILLISQNPKLETIAKHSDLIANFSPKLPNSDQGERIKKLINTKKLKFNNYQIIASSNSYISVLSYSTSTALHTEQKRGYLYLIDDENNLILLSDTAIGAEFSSDNKKLLWQTGNEIWAYWLKDDYTQPYKKAGDKELITRFDEKIKQAIWYKESDKHIIFIINDTIKIIETDDRGQKNIFDIITIKDPQIFSKNKFLYILSENNVYRIKIED